MPSRISGACNGCRSKKQKCSGDRAAPGCAQCIAAGIECTWPEQRKRGPAKGYIEALESRLHSTETLLLALLPMTDHDTLVVASQKMKEGDRDTGRFGGEEEKRRGSPPLLNKKTGIDYWDSFPLDSADDIRRWQGDCEAYAQHSALARMSPAHQSQSTMRTRMGSNSHRQSRSESYSGVDDYQSSVAAATAMAGMRNGTMSPAIHTSNSSRAFQSLPDQGMMTSMATPSASMIPQSSWAQPYAESANSVPLDVPMNMHSSARNVWVDSRSSTNMDTNMNTDTVPMPNSDQSAGLYTGEFQPNLFW